MAARGDNGCVIKVFTDFAAEGSVESGKAREGCGIEVSRIGDIERSGGGGVGEERSGHCGECPRMTWES